MSGDDDRVDLMKQISDLFDKEDMLAYFDFTHEVVEDGVSHTIEGICKISKPKEVDPKTNCLYLTFILDAPDDETWTNVNQYVKQVEWESLPSYVDEMESVLSMPAVSHDNSGHYFKQVDIYLHKHVAIDRAFLSTKLFHAIEKVAGLSTHGLSPWDDSNEEELSRKIEAIKTGIANL